MFSSRGKAQAPLGRLCLPLLASFALLAAALPPARADQAVTYQMNAAHTGVGATTGLVPPLTQKWSVPVIGPPSYAVIADGLVYVAVADFTNHSTDVLALSQADGHTVWGPVLIPNNNSQSFGDPAFDGGRVFVVDGGGFTIAFDALTGKQDWAEQMPSQFQFTSPPTAHAGTLYVDGSGSGGTLFAVSEAMGKVKWAAPMENGDTTSPCVTPTAVYVNCVGPQTEAFNPASGALLWSFTGNVEGGGGITPVFSEGNLYAGEVHGFSPMGYRFNAATGAVKGTYTSKQPPAVDKNTGFVVLFGAIQAENMNTQAILWTAPLPGEHVLASPIVINHVVYAVTDADTLYGFDEATGKQIFSAPLPDTPSGRGLNAAQGLLVVPTTGHLVAFD